MDLEEKPASHGRIRTTDDVASDLRRRIPRQVDAKSWVESSIEEARLATRLEDSKEKGREGTSQQKDKKSDTLGSTKSCEGPKHSPSGERSEKPGTMAKKKLSLKEVNLADELIEMPQTLSAGRYLVQGFYFLLRHPSLIRIIACYFFIGLVVGITGTVLIFALVLVPQIDALDAHMAKWVAILLSIVLCLAYSLIICFLTYIIVVPCVEGKLFERTFSLCGMTMPTSGVHRECLIGMGFTAVQVIVMIITFPVNFVPFIGQVVYAFANGLMAGWEAHVDYLGGKGLSVRGQARVMMARKKEYLQFGFCRVLSMMIPFANTIFMFSNIVGAALWAVDLEKKHADVRHVRETLAAEMSAEAYKTENL